jgi:hypothetical protein
MRINFLKRPARLLFMATLAAGFVPLFSTRTASANPRPLPFTYPYETLPEDSLEIEQYVDATVVRASETNPDGSEHRVWDSNYVLQTEVEYGITDRLELGTYLQFKQDASASDPSMHFDGIKQRLRFRFAEAGQWPVDVATYLELAEFHDEFEIEEKIILGKHFGKLSLQANAWVEQEFERGHDMAFIYNPTVGFTYPVLTPLHLGIEYWARGRFAKEATSTEVDAFNQSTHHFVGPAIHLQFGRFWWSVGPYVRLDHMNRSGQVGDEVGRVWVRSVFGLEL